MCRGRKHLSGRRMTKNDKIQAYNFLFFTFYETYKILKCMNSRDLGNTYLFIERWGSNRTDI